MGPDLWRLREKSNNLPLSSGVYIMRDSVGAVIYVGKAKRLKNRVSQYFRNESSHTLKVLEMVSKVVDFGYIVTDTEFEALVLECSLIKKYKPKYNVLLKDDKGYYYIKVTSEEWPRVRCAKLKVDDSARYYGPYTSVGFVGQVLDSTLRIFKLPSCSRVFSTCGSSGVVKRRACLNYYIGQCSGPCIGKISHEDYLEAVKRAEFFLVKGSGKVVDYLNVQMKRAADNLEFEKAAKIRDQLITLRKLSKDKQKVILSNVESDFDVLTFVSYKVSDNRNLVCFKVFNYSGGRLDDSSEYIFEDLVNEPQIARSDFIGQYYYDKTEIPRKILLDGPLDYKEHLEEWLSVRRGKKVDILVPKSGEFFKIVKMCQNNAREILQHKLRFEILVGSEDRNYEVLENLKRTLRLSKIPVYIEAFDVSNLKDSDVVAGMVVFSDGCPKRQFYRKFKIKTFFGQDDYRSMCEVLTRRFEEYEKTKVSGVKNGFDVFPDLVLIDGGKGHVKAVRNCLQNLGFCPPIFGMVKDKTHSTRALADAHREFYLDKSSSLYKFIYKIQEEVHRFSINYNKTLRSKKLRFSELTSIPGVGEVLSRNLMDYFKTLDNIKSASLEDLEKVKGVSRKLANVVFSYFNER